jgi:two-component system, NtrC family, sensor histidine kinase HydH
MKPLRHALLLGLVYGLMATAYIWLSGAVAARMASNVRDLARIEQLKGFVFVATTAVMLVLAAWIMFRRLARAIDERERLRKATVSAQSRVLAGELAAAVAHDFNNVLTVAQFAVDELRSGEVDKNGALLGDASRAIAQGRGLAMRLANTARGGRTIPTELRDLVPIARSMVRALAKLPRLGDCTIDLDACAEAVAQVDVLLFEQILANLVLNAADAAGKEGRVRVVLVCENDRIVLEVHDNGPGIPVERRATIFNAFETTKADGLGLGLLSVRSAVEAQGGTVDLGTSSLGGAMFLVRLPRRRANETDQAAAPAPEALGPALAKA